MLCASHSSDILTGLCGRAIWLDHGSIVADGELVPVLKEYKAAMAAAPCSPALEMSSGQS